MSCQQGHVTEAETVLKNFTRFTGKYLCWSLIVKTPFSQNNSGRLHLVSELRQYYNKRY